jgi:hypothetical protein
MANEILTTLLEHACPSIRYRIRTEILRESFNDEASSLQRQLLQENVVQEVLSWQGSDGWKSSSFHGSKGIEAGVRILREKGVTKDHPAITEALNTLRKEPDIIYRGIGKPGNVLDQLGFGGSQMIRAVVFAYAGKEDEPCVEEQLKVALDGFNFILSISNLEEITYDYKNKLVFKPRVMWPSIYHLRLLAYTHKWRTSENYLLMVKAISKLIKFAPIPHIHVLKQSQLIAPASFAMQDFNPNMEDMSDAGWMQWFHRMELLSRIGVIQSILELQKQVKRLDQILKQGKGWFTEKVSHSSFMNWGVYTGLSLENNWRTPKQRVYDLTFRSLLIKHPFQKTA